MFTVIDRVVTLPVVSGLSLLPQRLIIGHYQSTFTGGSHDLVLAEGERIEVPHRADLAPLVSSVCLCAIFDDFQIVLARQLEDSDPSRAIQRGERR